MPANTLTITDNRTGKAYEVPIQEGAISADALAEIKTNAGDLGLVSFDPALRNTATCRSAITLVDGRAGVLRYRGYPIEELARASTYLEVAYLILHGELPNREQFRAWQYSVSENYLINQYITRFLDGFRYNAHPMGVLISTVAALSTFFPDASDIDDPTTRRQQVVRLLGQVPTLAAFAHRRRYGMPYSYPDAQLSYVGNFLNMMFKTTELTYQPDPVIERAMDVLFILHADHGQACSTTTMRCVGSEKSDPFLAAAAAAAALSGRFYGEAYQAILNMLEEIGSTERVPAFIARVKETRAEPPGFGHRVYRTYDPRARILKAEAEKVFEVTGRPKVFDIALELDRQSAEDPYFLEQGLNPFVDYYATIIYHAIGFPSQLFPVLFAIPRFIGWAAHWDEMLSNPNQQTFRPRQIPIGPRPRTYKPINER